MSNKRIPVPFQDRVIISKTKPEEKSPGGIILPAGAIEDPNEGVVVAIGPKVGNSENSTFPYPQIGDYVRFGDYSGNPITVDGEEYLIMREGDVFCKL
jgi:chaperonin GroES